MHPTFTSINPNYHFWQHNLLIHAENKPIRRSLLSLFTLSPRGQRCISINWDAPWMLHSLHNYKQPMPMESPAQFFPIWRVDNANTWTANFQGRSKVTRSGRAGSIACRRTWISSRQAMKCAIDSNRWLALGKFSEKRRPTKALHRNGVFMNKSKGSWPMANLLSTCFTFIATSSLDFNQIFCIARSENWRRAHLFGSWVAFLLFSLPSFLLVTIKKLQMKFNYKSSGKLIICNLLHKF